MGIIYDYGNKLRKKRRKKKIYMSNFIPLIYPYTNMAWWLLAEGIKSSLTSFPYYLSAQQIEIIDVSVQKY